MTLVVTGSLSFVTNWSAFHNDVFYPLDGPTIMHPRLTDKVCFSCWTFCSKASVAVKPFNSQNYLMLSDNLGSIFLLSGQEK